LPLCQLINDDVTVILLLGYLLLDVLTVREGGEGGGGGRNERTEKKNTLDEPLSAKCEVKTGAVIHPDNERKKGSGNVRVRVR
jgi:hypothetical protein